MIARVTHVALVATVNAASMIGLFHPTIRENGEQKTKEG